ncbi:MAG: hypothetical protein U1D96_00650 [Eubacteriales bacterium]|nr:hypothetical protein [Eubacteriales bacterium]MDZ7609121.1 hypothetical protein [Eubacteriales bacterium]
MEDVFKLILSRLESLDNGQRVLQDGMKALQDGQKELFGGQKALSERQTSLEEGQQALVVGQKAIWEKLTEHDGVLGTLLERASNAETHLGNIEVHLGNVENRLETVENNQARLEMRMENEVIDKVRALFDDREVQNIRFDKLENQLEALSIDLSFLVTRVIRLEQVAK